MALICIGNYGAPCIPLDPFPHKQESKRCVRKALH
jgi:hypothetical protein